MNEDKNVRVNLNESESTVDIWLDDEYDNQSLDLSENTNNSISRRSVSLEELFASNHNNVVAELNNKAVEGDSLEDIDFNREIIHEQKSASTNTSPAKAGLKSLNSLGAESKYGSTDSLVKSLASKFDSLENLNKPNLRSNFAAPEINSHVDISKIDPTTSSKYKSSRSSASNLNSKLESKPVYSNLANMASDRESFLTLTKIHVHQDEQIKIISDLLEPILQKTNKTNEDMVILENNSHKLNSLKNSYSRQTAKLNSVTNALKPDSEQFENFLNLTDRSNDSEGKLFSLCEKVKTSVDTWKKDDIILDAQRVKVPEFDGDFILYDSFKTKFNAVTKGLPKSSKKLRLIEALTGSARRRLWRLIQGDATYEELWAALDKYYGNKKNKTDATINGLFNIKKPSNVVDQISQHFTDFRNQCFNVLTLEHSAEELLTAIYLMQIPGVVRARIESNLPKEQYKYTFSDLEPIMDDICRLENFQEKISNDQFSCSIADTQEITAAVGLPNHKPKFDSNNPSPQNPTSGNSQQSNAQGGQNNGHDNRGRGGGGYRGNGFRGRGGARGRGMFYGQGGQRSQYQQQYVPFCYICKISGHGPYRCTAIEHGPEMRKRLKELQRCDVCLVHESGHGPSCALKFNCYKCAGPHQSITCGGVSDKHPGSYVLANKPKS